LSTKIHAAGDASGRPVRLIAGPENDMARANALIDGLAASATIGDKSYDADPLEAKSSSKAVRSSSLQDGTERHLAPTRNSINSATALSVSLISSNSSAESQPDTTSCSSTSWAL
jgi:hypothetical protein